MRQALIYIELIKEPDFNFKNSLSSQIKAHFSDHYFIELDSLSDKQLFDYSLKSLSEFDELKLLIHTVDAESRGALVPYAQKILRNKSLKEVILINQNDLFCKLSKIAVSAEVSIFNSKEAFKKSLS